jgi:O-antigen/teichoic acid export membrane protein
MRRVLRGSMLSYGALISGKALTFASTVVLARLLMPTDFGVVAYALLMLGFLTVPKSVGMDTALIYRQDLDDDAAGEIFVIAVLSALLFTGVVWLAAPEVAEFFHQPRMTEVARVLSLSFVITALGECHGAQLMKRQQYGRGFAPKVVFNVVRGGVAIGCALSGVGYWSLVIGQLSGDAASTIACWSLYRWRPRLRLRRTTASSLVRYGASVALLSLIAMVIVDADEVIVGRSLGAAALGLYALAYTMPQLVTIGLASAVSQAVFPAFASLQQDAAALREGYLSVLRWSALVLAPIGVGLCVAAPTLIHLAFTRAWWPMIPAAQCLALYGTVFALGLSATDVWLAIGRPDIQWKSDACQVAILVPALIFGARLDGITGVAIAQLVMVVPYTAGRLWLISRTLSIRWLELLDQLRSPAAAAVVLAAGCLMVRVLAGSFAPLGAVLALEVVVGAVLYLSATVWLVDDVRAWVVATRLGARMGQS